MKKGYIKKILMALVLGIFLIQPIFAQVFLPAPPATFGLPIPNYGVPSNQAIHGQWNETSIINGIIAAILANNPNVSMNASFNVNTITGNSGILDPYGPLQNGFYLNSLDFESLLGAKTTLFAHLRNQDDFNRAAYLNIQDGHLKEGFRYTELIDRKVPEDIIPNTSGIDVTPWFGFPDAAKAPQLASVTTLNYGAGFNPNQYFYPIIDNFFVNDLQYTYNNGLSFFATDWLRSQTGQQFLSISTTNNLNEFNNGRDNNLSVITEGAAYTSAGNDQFYAATTARSWNNQDQLNKQVVSLAAEGGNPDPTGNLIYTDTRWSINQAGLHIPLNRSISFHGTWKRWDKISDGVFGTGFNSILGPTIAGFTNATNTPTNLQPGMDVNQYRAGFTFALDPNDALFFDVGHWEEIPNQGVEAQTLQNRNNADLFFRHTFGNQSLSLYGAWEQDHYDRTVDYRDIRYWTAFNPLVNTTFGMGTDGSATFYENSTGGLPYIVFTPAPGSGLSPFTQPVANIPCVPGVIADQCGTNSITYPVDGFVNITPAEGKLYGLIPGTYPVAGLVGRESVAFDTYVGQLLLNGPIVRHLNYSFKLAKTMANGSLFRTDPQDQWNGNLHLDWTPTNNLTLGAGYRLVDNKSNNSVWIYPFQYRSNTLDFTANYAVARKVSLSASYWNYIQNIYFTSPVLNTGTQNFIEPPTFGATGPVPGFGNLLDTFLFTPFYQYYASPLNTVNDSLSNSDQEIMFGINFDLNKNWHVSANYDHSEPRSFQNVYMANPVFYDLGPFTAPTGPNVPDGFVSSEPVLDNMQAVNGRENIWSLNFSRELPGHASLGISGAYMVFRNLAPRITGVSLPLGCTSTVPPGYGCGAPVPGYGTNVFEYGQSLDDGSIFSTAITYSKSF